MGMWKCGNVEMWKWGNVLYTYICIYWSEIWKMTGLEEKKRDEKFGLVKANCHSPLQKKQELQALGKGGFAARGMYTILYVFFYSLFSMVL